MFGPFLTSIFRDRRADNLLHEEPAPPARIEWPLQNCQETKVSYESVEGDVGKRLPTAPWTRLSEADENCERSFSV